LRGHRILCPNSELPAETKMLPLYILAALKNSVLRDGVEVHADERSNLMMMVGSCSTSAAASMLYPSMFALHRLPGSPHGLVSEEGEVVMPPMVRLSSESLEAEGVYLLETGYMMLLWIGKNAHPQLLVDLLNLNTSERLDGAKVNLPALQTDISARVCSIVNRIRQKHNLSLSLYSVRQGGAAESKMLQFMVEDRSLSTMSYPEWWNALSRQLQ
jgi:protein transport protein SEC24